MHANKPKTHQIMQSWPES